MVIVKWGMKKRFYFAGLLEGGIVLFTVPKFTSFNTDWEIKLSSVFRPEMQMPKKRIQFKSNVIVQHSKHT